MKKAQPPTNAAQLSAVLTRHCAEQGYGVAGPETDNHGYLTFRVALPGGGSEVVISFNGEVFELSFPGGFTWAEFAMAPDDQPDTLADVLAFLDAYADPGTKALEVKRRLRRPRRELHVSNGAVLRRRGWSKGAQDRLEG